MLHTIETPHVIKVYEEDVSGLTRRLLAVLTVYTYDSLNTSPEDRDRLRIEVS